MRFRARNCLPVLLFSPALFAQTRLTLSDAIVEALTSNPQIAATAARVDAAKGLRQQAGTGLNPRLVLQSENTRFGGNPGFSYPNNADSYAYIGQTFETGGKRGKRKELAEEAVKRSEIEVQLQRQQTSARVSIAYWSAAGAAQHRDFLNDEAIRFERVVQYHRDRVREGASAEIDLLRIEVERDRLALSASTAAQEAEQARIVLFREMGKSEFPPVVFADPVEPVPEPDLLPPDQVLERRSQIALVREGVAQARANLRLQQANAKVDPDATLGYKRTSGFDTLYASVQIPLPIRNKNQGQIAVASAEIRAAESQLAAAEALIRSEVEAAKSEYQSRKQLLTARLGPMRDRAEEVYRIAEAAYREGGLDLLRLLDAERARFDTRSAYTRALLALRQSATALSIAQGNQP